MLKHMVLDSQEHVMKASRWKDKFKVTEDSFYWLYQNADEPVCRREACKFGYSHNRFRDYFLSEYSLIGPSLTNSGRQRVYARYTTMITQRLSGDTFRMPWDTRHLHPLRDFYIPLSKKLPDNMYLYLPAQYSAIGAPVMLHKGKFLGWNTPDKKPPKNLQVKR